jgi:hypothetical protein
VHQLCHRIVFASLLIVIVAPGGALAQQAGTQSEIGPSALLADADRFAPVVDPRGPIRQLPTRFDVVNAPALFDQVLQIVDFPAGTWTPLHTPGGFVYTAVIDGAISIRTPEMRGDYVTYEAGDTFIQRPGEHVQVGNASAGITRIMATAVLPARAPLTIYQDGFTSNAYPTLTNWNYTHDLDFPVPGPETVYRSVSEVTRPEGPIELVQLVLDLGALQPPPSVPDWAQLAALYGVPGLASPSGEEVRESCGTAWGRLAGDSLTVYPHQFERVATNLCVSSAYVPFPASQPIVRAVSGPR